MKFSLSRNWEAVILKLARTPDRDKSTISRELKRNADRRNKHYQPELAYRKAAHRHWQKNKYKAVAAQIQEKSSIGWKRTIVLDN
jgi:IS30 family transposase